MSNTHVIVRPYNGQWLVTLPEYPAGQCWSHHETQGEAEQEAQGVASDMGYEGYRVDDGPGIQRLSARRAAERMGAQS